MVIPTPCREAVLTELHAGHPGCTRMKSLSRMYVWWPGITKDIEVGLREPGLGYIWTTPVHSKER